MRASTVAALDGKLILTKTPSKNTNNSKADMGKSSKTVFLWKVRHTFCFARERDARTLMNVDFVRLFYRDLSHKQNYKGQYYKMTLDGEHEETYICYD